MANSLGGVNAAEVATLVADNPDLPEDAGASALTRFVRRVSTLVDTRGDREIGRIAVFLQSNVLADEIAGRDVVEAPLLAIGNDPIGSKVWLSNAILGTAYALPYDCSDLATLFGSLREAALGDVAALVVDWRGNIAVGRLYSNGINDTDAVSDVVFSDDRIVEAEIKSCLDHFYQSSLRTPLVTGEAHGVKIWENAASGFPESRPEERIQGRLIDHLRARYSRKVVRGEVVTAEGRVDLVIFSRTTDVVGRRIVIHHWVLEIKALADRTTNGNSVANGVCVDAISKGVVQAVKYRDDINAEHAALCCYDMRREDRGDDNIFAHVKDDAEAVDVSLWRWFLFRDATAARQAAHERR